MFSAFLHAFKSDGNVLTRLMEATNATDAIWIARELGAKLVEMGNSSQNIYPLMESEVNYETVKMCLILFKKFCSVDKVADLDSWCASKDCGNCVDELQLASLWPLGMKLILWEQLKGQNGPPRSLIEGWFGKDWEYFVSIASGRKDERPVLIDESIVHKAFKVPALPIEVEEFNVAEMLQ